LGRLVNLVMKTIAYAYFSFLGLYWGFIMSAAYFFLFSPSLLVHVILASTLTVYPLFYVKHRKEYLTTLVLFMMWGFVIFFLLTMYAFAHAVFWRL